MKYKRCLRGWRAWPCVWGICLAQSNRIPNIQHHPIPKLSEHHGSDSSQSFCVCSTSWSRELIREVRMGSVMGDLQGRVHLQTGPEREP